MSLTLSWEARPWEMLKAPCCSQLQQTPEECQWETGIVGLLLSLVLLPLEAGPTLLPRHGCVCTFALLLMELLLPLLVPLPRKGSQERSSFHFAPQSLLCAHIAAAITGFHQLRGASFLIAWVISSRGTHCIKSLIQQAVKGAPSDTLRLLLISYTALMLPQGFTPRSSCSQGSRSHWRGAGVAKGCIASLSVLCCDATSIVR